jgi:triosephosphate isomerase
MNMTSGPGAELARGVAENLEGFDGADVVICPPFTALATAREVLRETAIGLGAQDVHWEPDGAFTGEISTAMLVDAGCTWVIVGHSERRTYFGETDETVLSKVDAALAAGLRPIVCIGETLEQREADQTEAVLRTQVSKGLRGLGARLERAVVAYEPVWAIGTGRTATPDQAQAAHLFIRSQVAEIAGEQVARGLRIQYGGSVKPSNAEELFALPDVDGGLIGGACLNADSFAEVVRATGQV